MNLMNILLLTSFYLAQVGFIKRQKEKYFYNSISLTAYVKDTMRFDEPFLRA